MLRPRSPVKARAMILSIHIPKTAGTSFRKALEERYGRSLALYYGQDDRKTDPRLRCPRRELAARLPALKAEGVAILHGHYQFKDVAAVVPQLDATLWTWLRDPVERVVSHFYFYRERPVTAALGDEVRTGGLSLEAFAAAPKMRSLQSRYLRGSRLGDYAFVGLSEQFEEGLGELFGDAAPKLPMRYNATREKECVLPELRARLAELNKADIKLYLRGAKVARARRRAGPTAPIAGPAPEKPRGLGRLLERLVGG